MFWFQLRPTFMIPVDGPRTDAIEKLSRSCKALGNVKRFSMYGEYGEMHVPVDEHRLWSPHLSFYVSEQEEGTVIHGRFAPRIEVWTFVWIVYLAMSFSAFFGLALAYSQWVLGESLWGLGVAALSILTIIILYVVAAVGQQWSADQMSALRARLEDVLLATGLRSKE